MAKRVWTEEQKEAARARLAAAREAKAKKAEESNGPAPQDHSSEEPGVTELTKMVLELQQRLEAAEKAKSTGEELANALMNLSGGTKVENGRMVGSTEKFSTDKARYSDPRERLAQESRLKRIAFDSNYELEFEVGTTRYQTKEGVNLIEPKFVLRLVQIVLDENGEPTNRRVGKAQMVFFEDPDTAIEVATRLGLPVDSSNEVAFLDEMRYMRMREWLFECFWPPRVDTTTSGKQQMVVGGQVVDTWEVSTEGNATIPFNQLGNKFKA